MRQNIANRILNLKNPGRGDTPRLPSLRALSQTPGEGREGMEGIGMKDGRGGVVVQRLNRCLNAKLWSITELGSYMECPS